jgi:hypothetical protein
MTHTRAPASKLAFAALVALSLAGCLVVATQAVAAPSGTAHIASQNSAWLGGKVTLPNGKTRMVPGAVALRDGEPSATQVVTRQ